MLFGHGLFVLVNASGETMRPLMKFTESYLSDAGNPVRYILFALAYVVLFPAALYMLSLTAVYNIKLWGCIKNTFILYIKTFPVTFLFAGCYFGILIIPNLTVKYILTPVVIVFAFPLYIVAWLLYSCRTFDRFINEQYHPEYFGKGIGGK